MSKHMDLSVRVPIEQDNPSIIREEELCIKCGMCRNVCQEKIGVHGTYTLEETGDRAICIHCGQCANVCPVNSIHERYEYGNVREAIQDPEKPDSYIGSLSIENMAVVTSGSYQRYFERDGVTYHHIIDPSEGRPADNGLSSVTIITESGMLGDALSTALFVLGLDDAVDYWHTYGGFQAVFVDNNGKIYITAGLENSFKCERSYEIIQ